MKQQKSSMKGRPTKPQAAAESQSLPKMTKTLSKQRPTAVMTKSISSSKKQEKSKTQSSSALRKKKTLPKKAHHKKEDSDSSSDDDTSEKP